MKHLCTYIKEALEVKEVITVLVEYVHVWEAEWRTRTYYRRWRRTYSLKKSRRDWLHKIKLDWPQLNQIHTTHELSALLQHRSGVFKEELGLVEAAPAKIFVDTAAQPRFCKPCTVPYALKEKVDQEQERLKRAGVIEHVQFADWAAPIVPVVKRDGSIRICSDFKVTINHATKVDTYPLPRGEKLITSLGRGKSFSMLNLAHAY